MMQMWQAGAKPSWALPLRAAQVEVTWSSALLSERPRPDTLKLRKRVQAWPLEFTFKVRGGCPGTGWLRLCVRSGTAELGAGLAPWS